MSDPIDIHYWKEVEAFSVRQLAMLLAGENPPTEIHESYDIELSPVAEVMLDALILQIESGEIKPLNYSESVWEVEVDGEFYTRFETNFEAPSLSREEFAIFAHKRGLSPPFLEYELENIDEIIKKHNISKDKDLKRLEELAKLFIEADTEINLIRNSTAIRKETVDSQNASAAKELISRHRSRFTHLEENLIDNNWWDPDHGQRNARGLTFQGIARKKGIKIAAYRAIELYTLKSNNQPIKKVPFQECLPE